MGCSCSVPWKFQTNIRGHYKLGPILGSGSFGQVRACVRRSTGQVYACKIMAKDPSRLQMFKNEVMMLQKICHRNIVRCVEVFEDVHFVYAILERCKGGELFIRIVNQKRFTEYDAARLCAQMLTALAYLHSKSIVHRDIKAENFLLAEDTDRAADSRLVLIDFGMSIQIADKDRHCRQMCGSPHYVAPELIKRQYRHEVDNWAIGIVIYLMLYGRYPFEGSDQKSIAQKILKYEPDYQRGSNPPSSLAIDFMRQLLHKDPKQRADASTALKHPWLSPEGQASLVLKPIAEDIIERAHRIASVERDYERPRNFAHEQMEVDRKLSYMDQEHEKSRDKGSKAKDKDKGMKEKVAVVEDELKDKSIKMKIRMLSRSAESRCIQGVRDSVKNDIEKKDKQENI